MNTLGSLSSASRPYPLALVLVLLYAALVVYASLYPFSGWRYQGVALWAF